MTERDSYFAFVWKLKVRELAWLWHHLHTEGIDLEECQLDSALMRQQISERLNSRDLDEFELAKSTQFIPEEDFQWVDKGGRQVAWVAGKAMKITDNRVLLPAFATLPMRQQVIAIIDTWETSLGNKQRAVGRLKHEWLRHQLDDKLLSWFRGEDEQAKCSMAWEWLEKHQPHLTRFATPFERHSELLDFFDQQETTSSEKELFVTKVKRRWSTQKSRANSPHKNQYNFVISNEINAALDKLAKKHKISRTKVLEKLILQESETGLYLE